MENTGASSAAEPTTERRASWTQQLRQELPVPAEGDIDSVARMIAASSIDAVATPRVCMWLPGLNGPLATETYREKQQKSRKLNNGKLCDIDEIAAQTDTKNLVFMCSIAECVNILGSDVAGDYFFTAQRHSPQIENQQENAAVAKNALKRLVPGHTYYAAAQMSECEGNRLVNTKVSFIEILTKRSQSSDTPELCHLFLRCPDYCWETAINKCLRPPLLHPKRNYRPHKDQNTDVRIMIPTNVFRSDDLNNPNNRTCTVKIDEYGNVVLRYKYRDVTISLRIFHKQNMDMDETINRVRTNCARYTFTEYDPEQRAVAGEFVALEAKAEVLARQLPASVDLKADTNHIHGCLERRVCATNNFMDRASLSVTTHFHLFSNTTSQKP